MNKKNTRLNKLRLSDVEETGVLTLYCRAIETQSADPILVDEKAVELVSRIDPLLHGTTNKLLKRLLAKKIDPKLVVHIALRGREYDSYARNFISKHPDGIIVNLGCGLDTRFHRINDGKLLFFDLDLPDVIATKRKLLTETNRYQMIAKSVFDSGWMDKIKALGKHPVMFQAEGVFMYLPEEKVRQLVLELQKQFPGCELVCEVVNKFWVQGFYKKIAAAKMKGKLNIGDQAQFLFGVSDKRELEAWGTGIEFLDEWSYFDSGHKKLGGMRAFAKWPLFRYTQYTVHYQLN